MKLQHLTLLSPLLVVSTFLTSVTLIIRPKTCMSDGLPKHFHIYYLLKAILVGYAFQIRKDQGQTSLINIVLKHQEENQYLLLVNKCFLEFFFYSSAPVFLICQLFLSANLLTIEILQILFYIFFSFYLPNISWVYSQAQLPQLD